MAKDVITRFKLETSGFDSKIKNAAKELSDVAKAAKSAGADFDRFTKDNLAAAKALGNISTSSTNAKDRAKELVGAFNDVARSYNQLTKEQQQSDFGKAMAQSLTQLQQRIRDTKEEMKGLESGGGLFGGGKLDGMLQVFGGNVMTKVAGMATGLVTEMGDAVKQGIELARQGEGIRIAFERLGRGDILQGLREATHGTVADIELMKAAVKFNDFKLPLEELGTMLAFAQQKAKDTGQSVDYMVDSIVTGLGRKSLMILDNLGLSATEIRDKMKQTGDMTKAVGAIIREQMAKAGDYVETAADRAAQANVSLQNKMEELGRKFAPIEEASNQLWTSMKIGILDIVGGPLAQLLNGLTEAGRLQNMLNNLNGEGDNTKVGGQLKKLQAIKKAGGSSYMFNSTLSGMMEDYNRQIMTLDAQIKNGGKPIGGGSGSSQDVRYLQRQMDALKIMRDELKKGAQGILNPKTQNATTPTTTDSKKNKEKELTELQQNQQKINDLTQEYVKLGDESTEAARERQVEIQKEIALLEKRNGLLGLRAEQAQGRMLGGDIQMYGLNMNPGTLLKSLDMDIPKDGFQLSDKAMKALEKNITKSLEASKKNETSIVKEIGGMTGGVSQIVGGLEQLGIEIPAGLQSVIGGMQAITTILTGIATTILAIEALVGADTFLPFANGGIVHAANGWVGGNSFSGDRIPALLNSGELVLNRAQQGVLADALQGGGAGNLGLSVKVTAEELRFILGNNSRRRGKGEYVTTTRLR